MTYDIEELLPVTAKLAEAYTSNESSSITYETANMLMEAVIYCINELENNEKHSLASDKRLSAMDAYQFGKKLVYDKTCYTRSLYDDLLQDFYDYGCQNYRDTILKGIPKFFMYYDSRFAPQDHLLTLDYPTLHAHEDLTGVDLIEQYLLDIAAEKTFMEHFSEQAIHTALIDIENNFSTQYMGNLCYLVLQNAVECLIADKPVHKLCLTKEDHNEVRDFIQGSSIAQTEVRICGLLKLLMDQTGCSHLTDYFLPFSHEYALRIHQ
ncbi:MAG: hypothetical protein EOM40_07875 [Clostridia bacterium]|nr:hypothetical protein [Clostridia bacterium]NCC43039.1 hypothetical protein [Clostridia bacterium]